MGEEGEQDKGWWVQVRVFEQNSLGRHKGVETQRLPRCPRTREDEANYPQLAAFADIEQFYYEGEVKLCDTGDQKCIKDKDQVKDKANTTARTPRASA